MMKLTLELIVRRTRTKEPKPTPAASDGVDARVDGQTEVTNSWLYFDTFIFDDWPFRHMCTL